MNNQITTTYPDLDAAKRWSVALLSSLGFTVIAPETNPVRMSDLRRKLGVPGATLNKALSHPRCPKFPEMKRKRRDWITVTPALENYLTARFKADNATGAGE